MAGLQRCVRAPKPWRPSKLRLLLRHNVHLLAHGLGSFQDTLNSLAHAIQSQHPRKSYQVQGALLFLTGRDPGTTIAVKFGEM